MIKDIQKAKQEEYEQIEQIDENTLNLEGDFVLEEKGLEVEDPENIDESSDSEVIANMEPEEAEGPGPKWENEKIQMLGEIDE